MEQHVVCRIAFRVGRRGGGACAGALGLTRAWKCVQCGLRKLRRVFDGPALVLIAGACSVEGVLRRLAW